MTARQLLRLLTCWLLLSGCRGTMTVIEYGEPTPTPSPSASASAR